MNLTPEENPTPAPGSDHGLDETLLDEALAQETPAELEAKILALTDPPMLSLLDEAMAPEANEQLNDRILAATQQHMRPGSVPTQEPAHSDGVLARIGPSTFRYAAAAAIALAVGLGVYFINQDPTDNDNTVAVTPDNTPVAEDNATDNTVPDWLTADQYAFDNATSPVQDALEDAAGQLEDATITRDTLLAELDAYEQFLDDFES